MSLDAADGERIGSVTIVAPMRDEAGHIDGFVEDVIGQDYDGPLDLVVADGRSTDDSVERLERAAAAASLPLRVLDNPERYVSHGLNRCLAVATGDLVVRLDVHSRYPPDYVRRCVEAADATGAANVGGSLEPVGRTPTERAVAAAMTSPFGGIGWTRHAGSDRVEVDTVTFGAFRREVFEAIGGFDEHLVRNQDDELNLRLRLAGGRVVLDPAISVRYVPRGTLRGVLRQYYEYGRWKPAVMRKHRRVLGLRSLAPSVFVVSVVVLAVAAVWLRAAAILLALELLAYAAGALAAGLVALRRRGEPLVLLPRVLGAFVAFHVGYGVGMLRGLAARPPR